jgi:hypothetical protein
MRFKKARELIALIKWELDNGEGAPGYSWKLASETADQLARLIRSSLEVNRV